jgi:hypothetical protein
MITRSAVLPILAATLAACGGAGDNALTGSAAVATSPARANAPR